MPTPVEERTLSHYQRNAEAFWAGTRDHDVSQNIRALLDALPAGAPLHILDFGCGPGRDIQAFQALGHRVTGLDGCPAFCEMARQYTGAPVLHQHFLSLDLPANTFDGIFCNASLFHVPSAALPRVLRELHAALKPGGVLFTSTPRGSAEGWNGERYGLYLEIGPSTDYLHKAGFEVIHHYYRPEGLPCEQQPWLAMVSRRV